MTTILASLCIHYELTSNAREHLGSDALSVWSRALEAECECSFPGVDASVTTRWGDSAASRFSATGVTPDGRMIAADKSHWSGVEAYGASVGDVPVATLRAIADGLALAESAAWDRACDAV
jgi:hypothetical protein